MLYTYFTKKYNNIYAYVIFIPPSKNNICICKKSKKGHFLSKVSPEQNLEGRNWVEIR